MINLLIYIFIGMLISLLLCNYLNPQSIEGYTPRPELKRCLDPNFPNLSGSVNGDFCYSDEALNRRKLGEELKCPSNNCISPTELVLKYKCVNNICEISNDSNGVSLEECKKVCGQDLPNLNMGTFKCVDGGCSLVPDNTGFVTKGECDAFCEDPDKADAEMVSVDENGINIMITNTKGGKSSNRGRGGSNGGGSGNGGNSGSVRIRRNGRAGGDREEPYYPSNGYGPSDIKFPDPYFGNADESVSEPMGYETMITNWGSPAI